VRSNVFFNGFGIISCPPRTGDHKPCSARMRASSGFVVDNRGPRRVANARDSSAAPRASIYPQAEGTTDCREPVRAAAVTGTEANAAAAMSAQCRLAILDLRESTVVAAHSPTDCSHQNRFG
jgi:hypothetical protein